jgi:putative ABC transport system permease protein
MDNYSTINVVVEGRPADNNGRRININYQNASQDYFRALGIPLLRGRNFTMTDDSKSPRVVIINETLAKQLFQDENPLGKRLTFTTGERNKEIWREIIGVVGDVKNLGLNKPPAAEIYECYLQHTQPDMFLVARARADPMVLATAVSHTIQSIDKDQPISNVKTMDQIVDDAKSK